MALLNILRNPHDVIIGQILNIDKEMLIIYPILHILKS